MDLGLIMIPTNLFLIVMPIVNVGGLGLFLLILVQVSRIMFFFFIAFIYLFDLTIHLLSGNVKLLGESRGIKITENGPKIFRAYRVLELCN